MTKLQILQHALGLDEFGRRTSKTDVGRNRFVCTKSGRDFDICKELVQDGLMEDCTDQIHPSLIGGSNSRLFVVTTKGRRYIAANSPTPPKRTCSQKRYDKWLNSGISEFMSFGEYLKSGCPGHEKSFD